ncbi:MAG: Lrp/AsnC family transcriptional regulator [Anaerolineae bacterium]|nr:Lrp/AsnC family transcriptional regulator [Anaerolineae bacterium]
MIALDDLDWRILELLQDNARLSFSEIGRLIGLSQPAVAERVRRLEADGVICGYHAVINPAAAGKTITAMMRISTNGTPTAKTAAIALVNSMTEIVECHKVTGDDCFIMKVLVNSIEHLETVIDRLSPYGQLNTSIVLGSPIQRRVLTSNERETQR